MCTCLYARRVNRAPAEVTAVAEREQQKTGGIIEAMWDGEAMSKDRRKPDQGPPTPR
jgi:hypothetical protein